MQQESTLSQRQVEEFEKTEKLYYTREQLNEYTVNMQELAMYHSKKEKFNIELSRYKQDCRKRALDLAAEQKRQEDRNYSPATEFTAQQGEPSKIDVLSIADKYYEWLTKELN